MPNQVQQRSPIAVALLPFVTFGIYSWYWYVKVKGELNQSQNQVTFRPLLSGLFHSSVASGTCGSSVRPPRLLPVANTPPQLPFCCCLY